MRSIEPGPLPVVRATTSNGFTAGLLEASLGDRVFDLVSVQYSALSRTPSNTAEHALLASVAPGGFLHGRRGDIVLACGGLLALLRDEGEEGGVVG